MRERGFGNEYDVDCEPNIYQYPRFLKGMCDTIHTMGRLEEG